MNPFTLQFEPAGGPLYLQLYQFLAEEIKKGNLSCGERLPSKKSLTAHLKISQSTVETAYEMLATEGYVRSVPRSGFYICELEQLETAAQPALPAEENPGEEPPAPPCRFDFRTNAVDTSVFPYATWAKLSKETIYQNPELLNPGHRQGDLCLREALAKYLHEFRGVNCQPGQIVIGAGIEYLIGLIAQLLNGSVFALENPGYRRLYRILKNNGRDTRLLPLDGSGMIPGELEDSGADAAYITPSHQFPTGVTMPIGRRMQLLAWARRREGRYLIEDDFDSEFRFQGRPIPSLQGTDRGGRVIYLSTFSKSVAPSIRIAYMVLPPTLLERYRRDFGGYSSTVSRFEQHTLAKFISAGYFSRHVGRTRLIYRQRRDVLTDALEHTGVPMEIIGETAGLHLLLRVKNGMGERELVERAGEAGVRVYGMSQYYLDGSAPDSSTVVAGYAGLRDGEIREAAELLKKAWTKRG